MRKVLLTERKTKVESLEEIRAGFRGEATYILKKLHVE